MHEERGKKCSLIIQATRMTLNIKGLKDWIKIKKEVENGIKNV
jgi:hypothetical protein